MTRYRCTTLVFLDGVQGHTTRFRRDWYDCEDCGGRHPDDAFQVTWDDPDIPDTEQGKWFMPEWLEFGDPRGLADFLQRLEHMS